MLVNIRFKCPYCGLEQEQTQEMEDQFGRFYTVYCDIEQRGCDKPLTIQVHLKPFINVYKLKEVT